MPPMFLLTIELASSETSRDPLRPVKGTRPAKRDVDEVRDRHVQQAFKNRAEDISFTTIEMTSSAKMGENKSGLPAKLNSGPEGIATRAVYTPYEMTEDHIGWGVVHLYRETQDYYEDPQRPIIVSPPPLARKKQKGPLPLSSSRQDDCLTLCILAVPSYFTPSDLLGFVGDDTETEISHVRMIRTSRINRYMVLLKFRHAAAAAKWRKENSGRTFNNTEPETCQVVFIKSIEYVDRESEGDLDHFPEISKDPFISSPKRHLIATSSGAQTPSSLFSKPAPPPTPDLVELPTCPVCLERMDETNGLLTILCQHIFHCSCLDKWKGSGCPICRYTPSHDYGITQYLEGTKSVDFGAGSAPLNACIECGTESNLWICLICGVVGCGRYDAAHAYTHFKESGHSFAMDLNTQRVWDYAGDAYVHRLLQSVGDGKLLQMPSARHAEGIGSDVSSDNQNASGSKLDGITMEYTHLLTSQLESQRLYFEEKVAQAADKASKASAVAQESQITVEELSKRLEELETKNRELDTVLIPAAEATREKSDERAKKSKELAQKLARDLAEERTVSKSLMARIKYMEEQAAIAKEESDKALQKEKTEKADLIEQNRDLLITLCSADKLKEYGEDAVEGTLVVPEPEPAPEPKKKKGKKSEK